MKTYSLSFQGVLWMFFSTFCYATSVALLRLLGDSYSPFLLTFFRSVIATIIVAPFFLRTRESVLHKGILFNYFLLSAFSYLGIFLWIYAGTRLPVAEFFALQSTTPLFTIAFAIIFLRERTNLKSWLATIVGFLGVIIILRPGIMPISIAAIAALVCSGSYASANTVIKTISKSLSTVVIVFYGNMVMILISLPMAVYKWGMPYTEDIPTIIGTSVLSTFGYIAVAKAIGLAPARVVQPINFMRMPIGAAFGWVLFSEFADIWIWIGALVIFCSATYVVRRG